MKCSKASKFLSEFNEAKEFRAIIFWKDGDRSESTAKKEGGRWVVSGDKPNAITDLGGKIFIEKDDGVFSLKGNRLIFQDNKGALD